MLFRTVAARPHTDSPCERNEREWARVERPRRPRRLRADVDADIAEVPVRRDHLIERR